MRKVTAWSLFFAVIGCGPNIPTETRSKSLAVVYDPAKSNLPAPNDLAMESGRVAIAPSANVSEAENELKAGFNGLDGFSSGSTVRVQFTGALSAASVDASSVVAFDLGARARGPVVKAEVARAYADCDHSLSLTSATGFIPGHTYLFAVRGGENGVRGQNGEDVYESPAFHFLRAGKDLRQHADALPGKTRDEKLATAERLEAVRQKLEPHFQTLEEKGLPRREVIALWTFTVHTRAEAVFDPNSRRIPFPNALLMDSKTGLVSLPAEPKDKPEQLALKAGFNTLDGFSTTAVWSIEATAPLDRATVTASTVRAFEYPSLREVTELDRLVSNDGKRLTVQPRLSSPLLQNQQYVVVLLGVKTLQGETLAAMPLPSVLKLSRPLVDDAGLTTVGSFCSDTAARLEAQRKQIDEVIQKAKLDRAQVSAVWSFKTMNLYARARALWETPYTQNLPLMLQNTKVESPLSLNIAKKITGTFTTFDRLDPSTRAFRTNGSGEPRQVEFVLWTPKGVAAGQKARVVVVGHGLTSDRNMAGPLAERLASLGMATMAIDFPLHGERTQCTLDSHCSSGSTCAADGSCRKPNGAKADFALLSSFALADFPGSRTASLDAWVDVANLFGTRDHFRQAIIDLSAQTRLIRLGDFSALTGGVGLDGNQLHYVGVSLGGIIGSEVAGIDPYFKSMLLNVGGADLVDLMQDSAVFGPRLREGLKAKGIEENTPAFEQFVNAARWALDEVDPLNLAPYAKTRPFTYRDPLDGQTKQAAPKLLRLQMATGDAVVPNSATLRLLTATGADKNTQFREFLDAMNHVFLINPLGLGQSDMANFLKGN